MIVSVISDVVWQALIAAFLAISLAWITRHEAKKQTDKAEKSAEAVKETVSQEVGSLRKTTEKTLQQVNGHTTVQLKLMAATTRRLADMAKNTPSAEAEEKAAEMAATALRDHEAAIIIPQP